jgi:two-component system sensor histidine kinase CpxA
MKVPFPLSLKVMLWLLLNLVLLGAAAGALLISQGGLSWDSLVAGPAGERLHSLALVIAAEVADAPAENRDDVLARFSRAYDVELLLIRNRGARIAGAPVDVPPEVRERIDQGPPGPRGPRQRMRPHRGAPGEPLLDDGPDEEPGPRSGRRGARFLVHTSAPGGWWVGLRVPDGSDARPPTPATLLVHAHSLWAVLLLLNLQIWLVAAAFIVVLSVIFWLPLVRGMTRSLRVLTVATERIADGLFDTRVPAGRRDELGTLGRSVNRMAERLDRLVTGQKRFLADVAHELGSPLGRLQVATEILETRAQPELKRSVADVREEVDQMAKLVGELLAFTRAGLQPGAADLKPVRVEPLAIGVLEREDPTGRLCRRVPADLRVLADEALLARALANLVRNALRYGGEGTITLAAHAEPGRVVIAVEDDGPGVPGAALPRLGEPFFRPDTARARETGGIGLGLAIVRSCAAACGGSVSFSNRTPRGFRAELLLLPA